MLFKRIRPEITDRLRGLDLEGYLRFFDDDYFEDLRRRIPPENIHLVTVHAPDGDLAAGAIMFECSGTAQYHLSGTSPKYHRLAPTKLVLYDYATWAAARGNTRLHLGGGLGADAGDPLFHFKAGFSSLRATFRSFRIVVDPVAYERLIKHFGAPAGTSFFPAYRAPHS